MKILTEHYGNAIITAISAILVLGLLFGGGIVKADGSGGTGLLFVIGNSMVDEGRPGGHDGQDMLISAGKDYPLSKLFVRESEEGVRSIDVHEIYAVAPSGSTALLDGDFGQDRTEISFEREGNYLVAYTVVFEDGSRTERKKELSVEPREGVKV